MNYDNDLYPTISPEDEATYMSKFDDSFYDEAEARAEFDSDYDADWREEVCDDDYESYDDGIRGEDAFLDSYYEECFEMDLGCDW